ncbi:MAG: OsmC family protein [Planctomycetota bacterium]
MSGSKTPKSVEYSARVIWTGNRGEGTRTYRSYGRSWDIATPLKPRIHCSNDPELGGDPKKPNPEDLLLSSLSACHMLWFLHLASDAGQVVLSYEDNPVATGETEPSGAGRFVGATLRPHITLALGSDPVVADRLHGEIHKVCFIARSVAFPVRYEATYEVRSPADPSPPLQGDL